MGASPEKVRCLRQQICTNIFRTFLNIKHLFCCALIIKDDMISRLLLFPAIYGIIAIAGPVLLLILVVVIWCRCTRTRSMNIKSPVSVKTVSNFYHYIKRSCFSKIKIAAIKPGTFGVIFRIF